MKQYEIMTIADSNLGEDGARDISNKIKDLVSAKRGRILDSDFWGKRQFAYEIDSHTHGYYEVIDFTLEPQTVPEFKKELNFLEGLVRYLVVAKEE